MFESGQSSCSVSHSLQIRLIQVWRPMTRCSRQLMERASNANQRISFWCRRCCRSSWFPCRSRLSPWTKDGMEKVGGLHTEPAQWCTNTLVICFSCNLPHFFFLSPGSEVECWADYNKRIIPIVVGAVVVGLLLIAGLTYLFIRDNRSRGYESLWGLGSSNNSDIDEY